MSPVMAQSQQKDMNDHWKCVVLGCHIWAFQDLLYKNVPWYPQVPPFKKHKETLELIFITVIQSFPNIFFSQPKTNIYMNYP